MKRNDPHWNKNRPSKYKQFEYLAVVISVQATNISKYCNNNKHVYTHALYVAQNFK